ncbi:MAG: hypothetical protein CL484_09575 [Acidobacteria bacterium]|nr:hypothetical protein [Acidobacteriota bacterium]
MTETKNRTLLNIARARLVTHQAGQVRTCLDALNDGQLWWRANEESNAIGNLVMHLCGSTRFYIGHGVGNNGYQRNRDAEFAEQGPVAKEELQAHFDSTMVEADRVLAAFDAVRMDETTDITGNEMTFGELILNQLLHFTAHTGQIVFATKLIQAGVIHEVWKTTPLE